MNRRGTIAAICCIALGCVLYFTFLYLNHTDIDPPPPPDGIEASTVLPVVSSHLAVPVSFEIAKLRELVNQAIPHNITGTADGDWKVSYNINIGDITIASDAAAGRINMMFPFSGHVQIEKTIIFRISLGSDGSGTGNVTAAPTFREDWTVDPRVDLSAHVPTWNVHTDFGDVGVAGIVEGKVNEALQSKRGEIEAAIDNALQIRSKAEQVWSRLSIVTDVSKDPPTWIRITPQSVAWKRFQYTPDAINTGLELSGEILAFLQEAAPDRQTTELPNLALKDEISDSFSISLPIQTSYNVINSQLDKAIKTNSVQLQDDDALVHFTSCTIAPYGSGILLNVGFESRKGLFKTFSGHLYISGKPKYDAANEQVTFEDLAFTAETNSTLANLASWLASPLILKALTERASINLGPELDTAKNKAKAELEKLKTAIPEDIVANLHVSDLTMEQLAFTKKMAFLVIRADGTMSAKLP